LAAVPVEELAFAAESADEIDAPSTSRMLPRIEPTSEA